MFKIEPRHRLPSIRRWLIRVHEDLPQIHRFAQTWSAYYPDQLTTLEIMVLVLEDRRFFKHSGFDIYAIIREFLKMIIFKRHGGASTIDMQFVRTATKYKNRTAGRKLNEILLVSIIQFRYSKIVILRSYLNCAYFGWGVRGATAASNEVFGKPDGELDVREAAMIASLLVFPIPRNETAEWRKKRLRRANYIESVYVRRKQRFDKIAAREVVKS